MALKRVWAGDHKGRPVVMFRCSHRQADPGTLHCADCQIWLDPQTPHPPTTIYFRKEVAPDEVLRRHLARRGH